MGPDYFFNLEQSPNPHKPPEILQIVHKKIDRYQKAHDSKQPINFIKVEKKIDFSPSEISSRLKQDVCWRFQKIGKDNYYFYDLDRENKKIYLHHPGLLDDYSDVLYQIINYRWAQKLEIINNSPKIAQKVRGTDRGDTKRKPLNLFRQYLDIENPERISFIANNLINDDDLSIYDVIP